MSAHLVSAPLNPITFVDHFRKSRSQCEQRYWQVIWVGKQPKGNVKAVQTLFNTSSLLYMPKPNISSYPIYTHMRKSQLKNVPVWSRFWRFWTDLIPYLITPFEPSILSLAIDRNRPVWRSFNQFSSFGVQMVNTIWYSIENHFILKLFYWQLVTNIYRENLDISSNSLLKYYGFLNYNAKFTAAKPGKTAERLQRHFGFSRESSSGAANNGRLLRKSKWQCTKTNKLNKH